MTDLIKNGEVVEDIWKTLRLAPGETPHSVKLPVGPVLVPVAVWKARRAELIRREYEHGWPLGVWLAADENPAVIRGDVDDMTVIAVEFDKFDDGSSYLAAGQLREGYGYRAELRAVGDVPRNRLAYLRHLGFDAFKANSKQFVNTPIRLPDFVYAKPRLVMAA
jgi:uncharacterized protein (DUF934 family)